MAVEISTVEELQAIQNDPSGDYVLVNNIDASATAGWNSGAGFAPIGNTSTYFAGQLDGAGYVVSGLVINRPGNDYIGLIGATDSLGLIHDIAVSGSAVGRRYVGLVCGYNRLGKIYRCSAVGTAEGNGGGNDTRVGGLTGACFRSGSEFGEVYDCFAHVAVTSGTRYGGGLVGRNDGLIERSYATGTVGGAGLSLGGFCGDNLSAGIIADCFHDAQTGLASPGTSSGTGQAESKTTAEMKTLSTFTGAGWDIVSGIDDTKVWGIDHGINDGYPFLQMFQDAETEPTEGSGTASLIVSTTGEGHTSNRGQGTTALATSSQGEGWRATSGSGQNTLSVSVAGEGYRQSRGSGELLAIIATNGEGYAAAGSYGETLLLASASGQGYVIRSGAGVAALSVSTDGSGQSADSSTTGILAIQTSEGHFFIQSGI